MTVIPFPPRDEKPVPVVQETPSAEEVQKGQIMAMMKAAIREAADLGIQFPNDEATIRDSLLCMEVMLSLLMRINGENHVFHRLADQSFEPQEDGSYRFYPPLYEGEEQ